VKKKKNVTKRNYKNLKHSPLDEFFLLPARWKRWRQRIVVHIESGICFRKYYHKKNFVLYKYSNTRYTRVLIHVLIQKIIILLSLSCSDYVVLVLVYMSHLFFIISYILPVHSITFFSTFQQRFNCSC